MSQSNATSEQIAAIASAILEHLKINKKYNKRDEGDEEAGTLAASALAQVDPNKHTSHDVATLASYVLRHKLRFPLEVLKVAGSVLEQAKR